MTGTRRGTWLQLLVVILVPLLAVGALLSLTKSGRDQQVQAAVVNLDQAVTIDGKTVPMGRQLAAEIIERDGDNISWTLADAASAAAGLRSGEYSAVVTIPEKFSAAATSFSANKAAEAQQATIEIQVSDNAPFTDAQLAQQIARIATESINGTLTKGYVDGVYVGFNKLGEQFVTIVDGAQQLHDGAAQLAKGTSSAGQGANQLSDGLGLLKTNGASLTSGATELKTGIGDLKTGSAKLSEGATQLSDGVKTMADKTPTLINGVDQLATGANQLLPQIPAYANGAAAAVSGVGQLKDGLDEVISGLDAASSDTSQLDALAQGAAGLDSGLGKISSALQGYASGNVAAPAQVGAISTQIGQAFQCPAAVTDPATCYMLKQAFEQGAAAGVTAGFQAGTGAANTMLTTKAASGQSVLTGAESLATGTKTLATELPKQVTQQQSALRTGLVKLRDGAADIVTKAQPIVDNAETIGEGATKLNTAIGTLNKEIGALEDGTKKLSTGAAELAKGASALDAGVGKLQTGAETFGQGLDRYVAGVSSAADGSASLATGLVKLDEGAAKLSDGTQTFAQELAKGADKVPSYSADAREKLSTVVAAPVAQNDQLAKTGTVPLTSLLLVAGLWLGALVSYVVWRPVPRTVLTSTAPSMALWLRTLSAPLVAVLVQSVVLGIVGSRVMHLTSGRSLGLVGLLALLGAAFVLANHALAAWLGNIGRGIAVLLLAVTVALATSSVANWLAPVGTVSPLHNGVSLIRTWASGGSGGIGFAGVAVVMTAICAGLSATAIVARRKLNAKEFLASIQQAS